MTLPRLLSVLLLLGGLAAPVAAAAPLPKLPGRTILSGCRQGECRWLRVTEVSAVSRSAAGELRRMRARAGSSLHPNADIPKSAGGVRIEWEKADRTDYAFCSTRRPAYAFSDGPKSLVVHYLDPFDLAGYQYATAGLYMRLCHGRSTLPSDRELRALGYRNGTRSEQVEARGTEALTRF